MPPLRNLTGHDFGKLTVISRAANKNNCTQWYCLCECGKYTTVFSTSLVGGFTRSCGCFHADNAHEHAKTHGASYTKEYSSWKSMKVRCLNPKYPKYHMYGGRGITIHQAWIDSFPEFLRYMGYRPRGTSLDRIDVNGNYEPGNVRWATYKQQARNQQKSSYLTLNGETKHIREWADEIGVTPTSIKSFMKTGKTLGEYIAFKKTKNWYTVW